MFFALSAAGYAQKDTIRVQVEMVSLPVVVTDRVGNHVRDLKAVDFSLLEDGVPQEIAGLAAVKEPISIALMLDVSGSTSGQLRTIQNEAIWFISDLRPDDSIAILSVADGVKLLEQFDIYHRKNTEKIREVSSGGLSAVYDGVVFALDKVLKLEYGRKALVFFSDGVDNRSEATREDTLEMARETDAPIYCIYFDTSKERARQVPKLIRPGGPLPLPTEKLSEYGAGFEYMSDLSRYSGGLLVDGTRAGSIGAAFKMIIEELSSQYSIGYYPKNRNRDGKYRLLDVKVNRPGMRARTRQGYYHR